MEEKSNLVSFAEKELNIILEQTKDDQEAYNMQKSLNDGVLKVVEAFADYGHSGFSAEMAIHMIDRLLRFQPLTPLTLTDDEWNEVGEGVFQNKRASNVFKQKDRFNGEPYCLDGPNGELVTLKEYPLSYIGVFTNDKE